MKQWELYNKLTSEQKKHIMELYIINEIENGLNEDFIQADKEEIFELIQELQTYNGNEENINNIISTVIENLKNYKVELNDLKSMDYEEINELIELYKEESENYSEMEFEL